MFFSIARFFLISSLFVLAIVTPSTLFPFIVGKYSFFRFTVDFALISFLMGLLFSSQAVEYGRRALNVIKSPLGLAVGIFVIIFLTAGFFGYDPANSFWSNFERGEGGAQIIHLYVFFVLLTTLFNSHNYWRTVLGYVLVVGFLTTLYGFLAGLGMSDFIGAKFSEGLGFRFQSSLGNPAYVAVYSIFLLFYVAYLLGTTPAAVLKKNFLKTGLIVFSAILFVVAFYFAATRGAFLGLLGSLFLLAVFLMISRKTLRKPLAFVVIGGLLVVGALVYFKNSSFIKNIPGARIFDISLSATTFSHRKIVWGIALTGFKERPLLGWGPENYYQIFDRHFDTSYYRPPEPFGAWFDRAHSLVLDYLAETGLLGLIAFLGIFATFYFLFFSFLLKSLRVGSPFLFNSSFVRGIFFALPIAYFIQGLVLFDVLTTYLNFFLFLALANHHFLSDSGEIKPIDNKARGRAVVAGGSMFIGQRIIISALIVAVFVFAYFSAYLPFAKARTYISGVKLMQRAQSLDELKGLFDSILNFRSPVGNEEVVKFLSNDIAGLIGRPEATEGPARFLVDQIEPHFLNNNVRHMITAARMYEVLWRRWGQGEDFEKSEAYFLKAYAIGPKLPPVLYGLITIYVAHGDYNKANDIANQILTYWPDDERVRSVLPAIKVNPQ